MKKIVMLLIISSMLNMMLSYNELRANTTDPNNEELNPWCGNYCMSFFTKTRSAATVGQSRLLISLKVQQFDWTQVRGTSGGYHGRTSGQEKQRLTMTLCTKYGWAEDHHIAIGIPYWFNDFDTSTPNDSAGLANVYIFEKIGKN